MDKLIILIPLLPLLSFLINGLLGKFVKKLGGWIAFGAMAVAAAISIKIFLEALGSGEGWGYHVTLWKWFATGDIHISIGFHVDQLTALMLCFVTLVGSMVFLYANGYMSDDPGFNRFFSYLSLFAFSMLTLVLADSLPLLFVGWEGVGLCSYLLISFYLDLKEAPGAGKKAFIVNRIGDFGFLVGMMMLFAACGTLNIQELVAMAPQTFGYASVYVTFLTLMLFLGCTGKSAQIPLFVWLPDAMAGPTPVSALIHAATMVTAGIYLVVRLSVLFALAPMTLLVIAVIAALTCFVAGTIALTQRDIKKVLAYSTVSQLGYMFLACGVGAFTAGIFHVFTHAFFKACLFLGAGSVIHAAHHEQDMFKLGGLKKWMPITRWTYLIACLSIAGFPLLAGFMSKDEILWKAYSSGLGGWSWMLYGLAVVTALMTAAYSFRSYFMTFEGETRLDHHTAEHMHESPWTMTVPLVVLAAGALLAGLLNVPEALLNEHSPFSAVFGVLGHHGHGLIHSMLLPVVQPAFDVIASAAHHGEHAHSIALELGLMAFSIIIGFCGIFLAWHFSLRVWPTGAEKLATALRPFYSLSFHRWWWDEFYNCVFVGGLNQLSRLATWFDKRIIDGVLHTVGGVARGTSGFLSALQDGQVQRYALLILIGANIILFLIMWG